ncbi:hypothetical protein FACS1894200_08780 [Spirochaetia bacterium]|nr:hypothetical protein FACS1894200_08780 [Spirochaetia bacterium]
MAALRALCEVLKEGLTRRRDVFDFDERFIVHLEAKGPWSLFWTVIP